MDFIPLERVCLGTKEYDYSIDLLTSWHKWEPVVRTSSGLQNCVSRAINKHRAWNDLSGAYVQTSYHLSVWNLFSILCDTRNISLFQVCKQSPKFCKNMISIIHIIPGQYRRDKSLLISIQSEHCLTKSVIGSPIESLQLQWNLDNLNCRGPPKKLSEVELTEFQSFTVCNNSGSLLVTQLRNLTTSTAIAIVRDRNHINCEHCKNHYDIHSYNLA